MEEFIQRVNELEDQNLKKTLIQKIYRNGANHVDKVTFDKNISGTTTRVNALYRIIKAGREIEALKKVISSTLVQKECPKSVEIAENLLKRIHSKDFVYAI